MLHAWSFTNFRTPTSDKKWYYKSISKWQCFFQSILRFVVTPHQRYILCDKSNLEFYFDLKKTKFQFNYFRKFFLITWLCKNKSFSTHSLCNLGFKRRTESLYIKIKFWTRYRKKNFEQFKKVTKKMSINLGECVSIY